MVFPVVTGAMVLAMGELGADGSTLSVSPAKLRAGMRAMALLVVPFTINIPAGVFVYWSTSNLFSIWQTMVLKVRTRHGRDSGGIKPYHALYCVISMLCFQFSFIAAERAASAGGPPRTHSQDLRGNLFLHMHDYFMQITFFPAIIVNDKPNAPRPVSYSNGLTAGGM